MGLNYKELYEKYEILEKENRLLRDEVELLRSKLSKEELGADNFVNLMVKEASLGENDHIVTMNSTSGEKNSIIHVLIQRQI